jgi:phage major head subunit gpT-like protein
MEVNSANLKALDLTIKTTFKTSKDNVEDANLFKKFADISPSNAKVQGILTLTDAPGMREFKSERVPGTISDVLYQVTHRKWESTLNVKREDIEDDNIGYIPAAVKKMTAKSRKHYTLLASAAAVAGFVAKMSDGKAFFHADRKNLLPGGVKALTAENYEAAVEMLETQTDTDGITPMGHKAKVLMVGPKNRAAANKIINKETLANGETNEHYKEVEVFVNPYLGQSLHWFVLDNSEGVMPITIVERIKADKMVEKNDLNSDRAFDADVFAWGLRGRYDAGYADPTLIVAGKGE